MGLLASDNDPQFVIVETADEAAARRADTREATEAELDAQDGSDGQPDSKEV